jgi:hypothetical protein
VAFLFRKDQDSAADQLDNFPAASGAEGQVFQEFFDPALGK